jgi:hypothetical protein
MALNSRRIRRTGTAASVPALTWSKDHVLKGTYRWGTLGVLT